MGVDIYEQAGVDVSLQDFYHAFYAHVTELYPWALLPWLREVSRDLRRHLFRWWER